jgi:tetratricopeptide (TPR) repeat protein
MRVKGTCEKRSAAWVATGWRQGRRKNKARFLRRARYFRFADNVDSVTFTPVYPPPPGVAAQAKANYTGVPAEGCDTSTRSGLWRRSPKACARAFAADPKNASLALAVAQAEHAHAHLDEAAQWAKRALALDPSAAEAYIIIARADAENGRDGDARTAYQRYLEIAPRGWHKAEALAALRRPSSRPR